MSTEPHRGGLPTVKVVLVKFKFMSSITMVELRSGDQAEQFLGTLAMENLRLKKYEILH